MYRLTLNAPGPLFTRVSWPDGRCRIAGRLWPIRQSGGGKSGLHGDTVAANGRRGRPQGKCHRKQTAFGSPEVRVKGCGKSAPRGRRRSWQGKPHREQDQIGVARRARKRGTRSVIRPATRVGCLRRPAMGAPDEWPSRRVLANTRQAGVGLPSKQNPAYRPAGTFTATSHCNKSLQQVHCNKTPRPGCTATQSRLWRRRCRGRRRRSRRRRGFGGCSRRGRRRHRRCLSGIPNDAQHREHGYRNEDCSLIHDFSFAMARIKISHDADGNYIRMGDARSST
jgi:hypothetical protein